MPAIQPARLKQQAALLAEHFDNPEAFVRSLHYLLDGYADRLRRPGKVGKPRPLIAAYNVQAPVLRQINHELIPLAQAEPEKCLRLCDALWDQAYLEFRLLTAMLIGQIPATNPEEIEKRMLSWISNDVEIQIIDALLNQGLVRLRKEQPQRVISLARGWLEERDNFKKQVGLRALLPLIRDPQYENLPVFFGLLQPYVRQAPSMLRPDILDVLAALARRTPQETAYYLSQTLEHPESVDTAWLIRQSLHEFPPELQTSLRKAAKEAANQAKEFEGNH